MMARFRFPIRFGWGLAVAAACFLSACLSLSGCAGGTSSEVGNPSLTLNFRKQGKPFIFDGYMRIVAAGSNPEFYYVRPDDGTTSPDLKVSTATGCGPSSTIRFQGSSTTLDWDDLAGCMFQHDELRLLKIAANHPAFQDFNIILQSAASGGDLGGWLASVHPDSQGYTTAAGDSGTDFVVDLTPGHTCSGVVDTASPAGNPLALFVPGSPYYALVRKGRFQFVGLPAGRLPLRWVDSSGRVFAVPESLGLAGGGETPLAYSLPGPIHSGDRIDSIILPDPYPMLSLPVASPPGEYPFYDSVEVTLSAPAGASIYYTTDGTTPTPSSKQYEKPILMRVSTTLYAVAYAPGFEHSPVSANNYVLALMRPSITPGAGEFVDSVRVEMSGPTGSTVHYTLDGSIPTKDSPAYPGSAIVLRASTLVQAVSVAPGFRSSEVVSSQYVIKTDSVSVLDTTAVPPAHP
ncbi:MAG: chitobiase/beta-hexosaminidase C-terminal domain-containing protein [Fibrobacteres bacterium]|nr:chitobiase/beta-hexosaminidase C-terminal domain-containing protein [Fibrobacterota bacterium]